MLENNIRYSSRRSFIRSVSTGFGALAFAAMHHESAYAEDALPLSPKQPHFSAKAKRIIFLCMEGGPSHVDTFDYKPELKRRDGQSVSQARGRKLMKSPWEFQRDDKSGLWISDLYPNLRERASDLCLIKSMQTDIPAHPPAFIKMHTGMSNQPRPSMGAWVLYGLGTQNQNLPGFVTISPPQRAGGAVNYGSAFLPAAFQGTPIGSTRRLFGGSSASVPNLNNDYISKSAQKTQLDYVQSLNQGAIEKDPNSKLLTGLMNAHDLAYRMQGELPPVIDLDQESRATQERYGIGNSATENFGRQCLMARRLIEAGVRFVEVNHGGWDQHANLTEQHGRNAEATDKPIAGLLGDLAERGMLEDTLVIWSGEFGRTPYAQRDDGRDHNHKGFTTWMAGGGVKSGFEYGATDEIGHEAVENPVHIHDWHATILHLLGLNHEQLTYRYAGRDMRLTEVGGNVVKGIVA